MLLSKSFRYLQKRNSYSLSHGLIINKHSRFKSSFYVNSLGTSQYNENINLDHLLNPNSQISSYWIHQIKKINKPLATNLISQLVADNPLGFEPATGPAKKGSLLEYTIQQKKKHPDKVILMRTGDFYETYGVDALMMVAYAGLNPMGNKCKAGCPVKNVQSTLDGLTSAGLSVAVYEEVSEIDISKSTKQKAKIKNRLLTQIVSPASSTYIYDLRLRSDDIEFRDNRPVIGIIKTVSGYTLCQVFLDELTMNIHERLTEEALRSILSNTGYIEPIYLQDASTDQLYFLHGQIEKLHGYKEGDFPVQMMRRLGRALEIDTDRFRIRDNRYDLDKPRPIYTSTALQIGLIPNENVPDLIPHILPASYNAHISKFFRRWLLNPPPRAVSMAMRSLCTELSTSPYAFPPFSPVSIGKVISLINANQSNVALFRDILTNVNSLSVMLQSPLTPSDTSHSFPMDFTKLIPLLLDITTYESGISSDQETLLEACNLVKKDIEAVIAVENKPDEPFQDPFNRIPDEFFRRNEEEFRGKVNPLNPDVQSIYSELHVAATNLCEVANRDFPDSLEISHDILNNAILVKEKPSKSATLKTATSSPTHEVQFIHFIDRKGKTSSKRFTTPSVEKALEEYLSVATVAPLKISKVLQKLSVQLSGNIVAITQASHWAVILQSALSHTISSLQKGWTLPELVEDSSRHAPSYAADDPANQYSRISSNAATPKEMLLHELSPYWMDRSRATRNNVVLKGIFLLTAPNMSGKSTLMRSVLVAALLANCGLFIPASQGSVVPRYDNFFLRTASYDIPSEAKSAFALEMDDMRVVLRDCTNKSLVMIDELGKGTSSRDGSALAGALLEFLDRKQVSGIFATHLHELFLLPLQLNHVTNKKMDVQIDKHGRFIWCYRLEDGTCLDSMALETAKYYNVDTAILNRAEELIQEFDLRCRPCADHVEAQPQEELSTSEEVVEQILMESPMKPNYQGQGSIPRNQVTVSQYDLDKDILPVLRSIPGFDAQSLSIVQPDWEPPAMLEGRACLYVLHIHNRAKALPDILYVGETESIRQRLIAHRAYYKKKGYSISTIVTNMTDKSHARSIETQLIKSLKEKNFDIERDSDIHHKLFSPSTDHMT